MDDSTPTLLIGDFNTHSRRWSLPDKKESSWAPRLLDWLNTNLLSLLNPPRIPTWHGYKESDKPSVLDLAFTNNGALIDGQLGEIVVSCADSLSSDHAALLTIFTPSTHIALLPPPAPKGYKIEEEQWEAWTATFRDVLTFENPSSLDLLLQAFEHAIETTSHSTLKPKCLPDPKGLPWWNEECTTTHATARTASNPTNRRKATKALCNTLTHAKRAWAHQKLHHAVEARDIWIW